MTEIFKGFISKARPGLPWLVLLAAIWAPVVYLLGAQWSVYAEYQYGWAVAVLCLFLAIRRFDSLPAATMPRHKKLAMTALVLAGLVFWVMRVLQEASPLWRVASYGLAIAAATVTLLVIYLTQGGLRAVHFAFPILFFLVAVPWPTPVEGFVIQSLTRFNAGLVTELLNVAGVPALQHGNVIEVGTGQVGIDEACSGIRSLQATLMIALFFGEFYRLSGGRRGWLLVAGPLLAMAFNLARTLVLVSVAAKSGLLAMERWHDPTGVILLVGCFFCLWLLAVWLARGKANAETLKTEMLKAGSNPRPEVRGQRAVSVSTLAVGLAAWSVTVAVSTEVWFRSHENRSRQGLAWVACWPAGNPTLQTSDIPPAAQAMLQCDQHETASWTGDGGFRWQAFYLRWAPADNFYGRVKVALSKSHNPAVCLTASGMKLEAQLAAASLPVQPDFTLNFDRFVFSAGGRPLYVFFSQTEDLAGNGAGNLRMTHLERLRAALAGSRNYGQINFEVALAGPESPEAALAVLRARLPSLITIPPAVISPPPR